jgi:Mg-chelatase subunit ChlI
MAHAALEARTQVTDDDILAAAELALPHRLKRQPFDDNNLSTEELRNQLSQAQQKSPEQGTTPEPAESSQDQQKKKTP